MFSVGDIVILKTDVGDYDKGIKGKVREIRLEEMYPYYMNTDYDKPIARRIVEEAGIPRDAFGGKNKN